MADHLVGGCLFTVRTTNLFIEILVDESCLTMVEQTMKRGLFKIDRKASTESLYQIALYLYLKISQSTSNTSSATATIERAADKQILTQTRWRIVIR